MAAEDRSAPEVLAELVAELLDQVTTAERLPSTRQVNRGGGRSAVLTEVLVHRTCEPGLLDQLQAVAARPARRLHRSPITTELLDEDGHRHRQRLRASAVDEHGRPLLRPRWDEFARRTVLEPVTIPLTRVARAAPGTPGAGTGGGVVLPGAAVPSGSAGWDADGALAPGRRGTAESRPPATDALDVLLDIHRQARRLYARMLRAAASAGHPRDAVARRGLDAMVRHLVSLAAVADARTAGHAVHTVRSWVRTARTVIGYEAPIVHLRDICCWDPGCHGRLAVRADGSTPVWCTAFRIEHGPAPAGQPWPIIGSCPVVYRRHQWLDLFTPGATTPIGAPARRHLPHSTDIDGSGGRA